MGTDYSPRQVAALAIHYYDDHSSIEVVDAYADFERALSWLATMDRALVSLLDLWMQGTPEEELALLYRLKARSLARLLDQLFEVMAHYLSEEYPLDIPQLSEYIDVFVTNVTQ